MPDKSGSIALTTDTPEIPFTTQFEYTTVGTTAFLNVPAGAKYMTGVAIGAGGGSGSGAVGAAAQNRTGGGSGSAGGTTPFSFDLQTLATRFNCTIGQLQFTVTVGGRGPSGAAVSTPNTVGRDGISGGTSNIRMKAQAAPGDTNPVFIVRAPGGARGIGGRLNATSANGGGQVLAGAAFPGQAGQQGRNTNGNAGGSFNSGAAAGGGGAGTGNGSPSAQGGTSGPSCFDRAGDLTGTAVAQLPPAVSASAATNIPAGLPGGGGAGGSYRSGFNGGAGGAGFRGGSGGGGAVADNGFTSGAGGASGDGYVMIRFSPYPLT